MLWIVFLDFNYLGIETYLYELNLNVLEKSFNTKGYQTSFTASLSFIFSLFRIWLWIVYTLEHGTTEAFYGYQLNLCLKKDFLLNINRKSKQNSLASKHINCKNSYNKNLQFILLLDKLK
uniref:CSON014719 protein n=1 Tax=Culicoides sonorensis TaxID=179676 RepID=A0A336MBD4_CULSO